MVNLKLSVAGGFGALGNTFGPRCRIVHAVR